LPGQKKNIEDLLAKLEQAGGVIRFAEEW